MTRRIVCALGMCLFLTCEVSAQTVDPCAAPTTADTVFSGRPATITWQLPTTSPASATDATPVPTRVDGFLLAVDAPTGTTSLLAYTGTKSDTGKLTPTACGTTLLGFKFTLPSGVAKGSHTVTVSAYNAVLDANGTPTGQKQEGPVSVRPFVAIDLFMVGAPPAPAGVRVWR